MLLKLDTQGQMALIIGLHTNTTISSSNQPYFGHKLNLSGSHHIGSGQLENETSLKLPLWCALEHNVDFLLNLCYLTQKLLHFYATVCCRNDVGYSL